MLRTDSWTVACTDDCMPQIPQTSISTECIGSSHALPVAYISYQWILGVLHKHVSPVFLTFNFFKTKIPKVYALCNVIKRLPVFLNLGCCQMRNWSSQLCSIWFYGQLLGFDSRGNICWSIWQIFCRRKCLSIWHNVSKCIIIFAPYKWKISVRSSRCLMSIWFRRVPGNKTDVSHPKEKSEDRYSPRKWVENSSVLILLDSGVYSIRPKSKG